MSWYEYYGIFAVATGLVSVYELYLPALRQVLKADPDYPHTSILYTAVFFLLSTICAPLMLIPCLHPTIGEQYRSRLVNTLLS